MLDCVVGNAEGSGKAARSPLRFVCNQGHRASGRLPARVCGHHHDGRRMPQGSISGRCRCDADHSGATSVDDSLRNDRPERSRSSPGGTRATMANTFLSGDFAGCGYSLSTDQPQRGSITPPRLYQECDHVPSVESDYGTETAIRRCRCRLRVWRRDRCGPPGSPRSGGVPS